MPNAAAGAHPLNAAGRKYSLHTGGFLILDRSLTLPSGPQRDSALREGNFQYRAHAAIAAMFARAFNMAASLASGPNARPSARTMVTSVNPMKDSTPVR